MYVPFSFTLPNILTIQDLAFAYSKSIGNIYISIRGHPRSEVVSRFVKTRSERCLIPHTCKVLLIQVLGLLEIGALFQDNNNTMSGAEVVSRVPMCEKVFCLQVETANLSAISISPLTLPLLKYIFLPSKADFITITGNALHSCPGTKCKGLLLHQSGPSHSARRYTPQNLMLI